MANIFENVITPTYLQIHKDMMNALIDNMSVPCRLVYGDSNYTVCPNCLTDPIGKKSANRYLNGGPIPFQNGQVCPMCNGAGLIPVENTETLDLVVIWDWKQFLNFDPNIQSPAGLVQTLSSISLLPKLKRAKEIIFDTTIEASNRYKFKRDDEPVPAGLGASNFITIMWRRIQ